MNRRERRAQARQQRGRSLVKGHEAALAFARELIRRGAASGDGGSLFEPMASRTFAHNFMRLGLEWARGRMWLVEMALAGEEDADAILREAILECQSWHRPMPDELIEYNRKLVAGMVPPPGWSGPKKKNQLLRDISIALVVAAVCDRFDLQPTGRSARRHSGCAIVGEALDVIGMALSYEAVASIWKIYGRHMPNTPGWVAAMGPLPLKDQ